MKKVAETPFEYELVRSKRATADIVLEPDGRLVVRVPEHLDDDSIAHLVETKRFWIHKNLAEWRELNSSMVLREFVSGEGFLYFGRTYRLSLLTDDSVKLDFQGGRFLLGRHLIESGDPELAKEAFREFYADRALRRIKSRLRYYCRKVGVTYGSVKVGEIGNRWGTCSPSGNLIFHWKCCMAPLSIIDYIVVHELCHRHHLNHTEAFWNEVDKVLPNYRESRNWLRANGASLEV